MRFLFILFVLFSFVYSGKIFEAMAAEKVVEDIDQAEIVIPACIKRPRIYSDVIDIGLNKKIEIGYKYNGGNWEKAITYQYKKSVADTNTTKIQVRIKLIVEEVAK